MKIHVCTYASTDRSIALGMQANTYIHIHAHTHAHTHVHALTHTNTCGLAYSGVCDDMLKFGA